MRDLVKLDTTPAPARCADFLANGRADAALVPVIEYWRMSDVAVVPGVCVGARRRVRSVVLVTKRARLEDVETVALDASSRTSAALVQIIFREFVGRAPAFAQSPPDVERMLAAHDAALVIGDPAMTIKRSDVQVFDLASLWNEYTGFGFVFALWMVQEKAKMRLREVDWAAARDEGLKHREEIADEYAKTLGLPRARLVSYLNRNVCYELDDNLTAGLNLFYRLAHKHGLAPTAQELQTISSQTD